MKLIKRFVKALGTSAGFSLGGSALLFIGKQFPHDLIGGLFVIAFFICQILAVYGFFLILLHGDNAKFHYGHGIDGEGNPITFTVAKNKED